MWEEVGRHTQLLSTPLNISKRSNGSPTQYSKKDVVRHDDRLSHLKGGPNTTADEYFYRLIRHVSVFVTERPLTISLPTPSPI